MIFREKSLKHNTVKDSVLFSVKDLIRGFDDVSFAEDYEVGENGIDPLIEVLHEKSVLDPKVIDLFAHFKDQVVVDLGAGMWWRPYSLICKSEAQAYIGVEKFWAHRLAESLEFMSKNLGLLKPGIEKHQLIPAGVAAEDMLSFLMRIPDSTVSIFHSGLEEVFESNRKYRNSLASEVERVLHPHGAYIAHQKPLPITKLNLILEDVPVDIRVFRKDSAYGIA